MATKDLASQIRQDEQLDVSYERVEKLNAPLLIIGLGGTGADAVRTVKRTFAERFVLPTTADGKVVPIPRRTGYLVFDSDTTGKDGLDDNEIVNIAENVNLGTKLEDHSKLTPSQKRWVHRNLHKVGPQGGTGAGTYRAASRLMLDERSDTVFRSLQNALTKLSSTEAGSQGTAGATQIIVVTGIGGGTGSGTFLDVGQIIRHIMKTTSGLQHTPYNLTCYIVMPDLSIAHVLEEGGATAMVEIIQRNSYAALKELDFWMDYDRHRTHYEMEYTNGEHVTWQQPYDHVTLMCGSNIQGQSFSGSYKLVQRTIAETLLHYMADEAANTADGGTSQFSFLSYENNLDAQTHTSYAKMFLPLNHGYRAVGAYSKRIPKKKILFYEGMLLYKTFMPPRNEYGKLVPNDKLLRDGKATQRFGSVAMKTFPLLYQDFAKTVPFPKTFQDFNAKNNTLVEGMRRINPPAHQKFDQWERNSVAPVAREFAENYRKAVWDNFAKLCKSIMSDPAFGPYSLLQYLKDESVSLRVAFRNYANSAQSACNNLYGSIGTAQQICVNSYQNFLKPPLLGGDKAVQTYLNNLRDLLDTVRQYELAKQYAHVMELICKSIDAYIENALEPMCDLLEELETDFGNPQIVADSLSSDLFDVSTLHQNIQDTFASANADNAISRSFLGKLCESTFEFEPNVDTGSCGMTFLFRQDGRIKALQLMKQEMDLCFKNINSMSLESILQLQCYDPDPAAQTEKQQKYISNLANSVVDSAIPLFSIIPNSSNIRTNAAKCLYFSVPNDAPSVLAHLNPGGKPISVQGVSMTPKASALTDHIYCSMTWDVLPLYSYGPMESLKRAYDTTLNNPNHPDAPAIHLVWNGDPEGDYRQNWSRLPAPSPYYLFGSDTVSQSEKNEYEAARKLAMRALACGMLTIDSTVDKPVMHPTYTFHVFRDAQVPQHNSVIQRKLNELLARKNPVTGAPLSPDAMLELLNGFVATAEPVKNTAAKSPTVMNTIVGINEHLYKINPFDKDVASNPDLLDQAKAKYYELTKEYAVHILLQTPALMTDVEYQIESFEMISREIDRLAGSAKIWAPRIAYAETFAKLYAYDLINFDMMGNPIYVDEAGEIAPLIQAAIVKEDLADCRQITKSVAVAADLTAEHAIRQSLEFKLGVDEQTWKDDALYGRLTREGITKQIDRLEDLLKETTSERKTYISEKQTNSKADHALINKYVALLEGVEKYAVKRIEDLKKTLTKLSAPAEPVAPVEAEAPVKPADGTWNCACGNTGIKGKFCPECGAKKPEPKPEAGTWNCACGNTGIKGKFCPECGAKKPEEQADGVWTCPGCGKTGLTGKFCLECGTKKPEEIKDDTWNCACGNTGIKGKFCPECGAKKPSGAPVKLTWICTECGKRDITGKFCPECGTPRSN